MSNQVETPGQAFARQVRESRERKPWSQEQLVDRLREMGVEWDRATLARLEAGRRKVSLDEALLLAAALGVSPQYLVLPRSNEPVQLAPNLTVEVRLARDWMRGFTPLSDDDERSFFTEVPDDQLAAVGGSWETLLKLGGGAQELVPDTQAEYARGMVKRLRDDS